MAITYVPRACMDPVSVALEAAKEAKNQAINYVPKNKDYSINYDNGQRSSYGAGSTSIENIEMSIPKGKSAGLPKLTISEWKNLLLQAQQHVNDITNSVQNGKTLMAMIKALKSGYKPVMFRELYKASWNSLKLSAFSAMMAGLDTDLGRFVIGGFPQAMRDFKTIFDAIQDKTFKEQFLKGIHEYYGNKTANEVAIETANEGIGGLKIFLVSFFQGVLNTLPMSSGDAIKATIGNLTEGVFDDLIQTLQTGLVQLNEIEKIPVDDPMKNKAYV